jgi:glycosidase
VPGHAIPGAIFEFHIARIARDRYQFDEGIFQFNGNAVIANFRAARLFAQKINQRRDLVRFPEQAVRASQISAMGLIDEIAHWVFRSYRQQANPSLLRDALAHLDAQLGHGQARALLRRFSDEFPPLAVYRREQGLDEYLAGQTGGMAHEEAALEELLMLWLSNANPAFAPYLELFDDQALEHDTPYQRAIGELSTFLRGQPAPAGAPSGQSIVDLLRAPALVHPHSLEDQLTHMLGHWSTLLGPSFPYRLLSNLDHIREEERPVFGVGGGDATAASIPLADFQALEAEPEQFTPDREWMPRLVLLAKNAFVWLDQLSKQFGRPITTLADIPDHELDQIAARGFTGLWLIGLWERSAASKRIKQIMGNPDAVASAYSLYDYVIAHDLGGEVALEDLRQRAWRRGIRLASDMVPNHVGIDGRWVMQHPDWFVGLDDSPFPSYSFSGPDLSEDEQVGIFLEDHYYSRTDAAVVFKRVDRRAGSERYIYHGNDGTSMPWNDTAQLNYLLPEVREAVIQTILHVARHFPIIRFDAAMTLAKRHFHRLWYPQPGSGGDIPSRAEYSMTREEFDRLMPQEFWREVVDRCAVEAPDTLLLAEAFWLMEGYFVRTLGMHRVYNSAFMVMLRDEDNAKYRQVLKNTLEFDPEIMRRYVNFMNNPDERTAVDQFGKDDKYFGIASMLVTLPGLPMFGHGQVQGFTEKYGMEYRRAYWEETPDQHLIWRHEREIFPLMHKRYLFAGVEQFLLYDFYTADSSVNEDVFAYSNRHGDECGLVLFHNRFASARGWVKTSVTFASRTGQGDEKRLVQHSLSHGLGLRGGAGNYAIFRDVASNLEYIRSSRELATSGLYVELGAYQYHVFVDWREVHDADGRYANITAYLAGRGVPSIEIALRETFLAPVLQPFARLVNAAHIRRLAALADGAPPEAAEPPNLPVAGDAEAAPEAAGDDEAVLLERLDAGGDDLADDLAEAARLDASQPLPVAAPGELDEALAALLDEAARFAGAPAATDDLRREILDRLQTLLELRGAAARSRDGAAASPALAEAQEAADDVPQEPQPLEADDLLAPQQPPASAEQAPTPLSLAERLQQDEIVWGAAVSWIFAHALGAVADPADPAGQSRAWLDEWLLGAAIERALRELGAGEGRAASATAAVKIATEHQGWLDAAAAQPRTTLAAMLADEDVRRYIGVNRYQSVLWFSKERFEDLLWWLRLAATILAHGQSDAEARIARIDELLQRLARAAADSEYQLQQLMALATAARPAPAAADRPARL